MRQFRHMVSCNSVQGVHRRRNGGSYTLFRKAAIDETLAQGGMQAMRERLANRSKAIARGWALYELPNARSTLKQIELEDRLNARVRKCSVK